MWHPKEKDIETHYKQPVYLHRYGNTVWMFTLVLQWYLSMSDPEEDRVSGPPHTHSHLENNKSLKVRVEILVRPPHQEPIDQCGIWIQFLFEGGSYGPMSSVGLGLRLFACDFLVTFTCFASFF